VQTACLKYSYSDMTECEW